jgi:hypothetical protein
MRIAFSTEREDVVPAHKALPLPLSLEQERELKNLVRAHSTPQKLAERARIVLLSASGFGIEETARQLVCRRRCSPTHSPPPALQPPAPR